ncbi:MAG: thioesterase family protein [Chloroflexota bacterium]|nr:thioesterase family protein [Chloroflexota bacterium]
MNKNKPFTYYHPIVVRYGDLDPQGHVNNAVVLTYLESARLGYYEKAGIWKQDSGITTGMVVAHIDIDYLAPIYLGQAVRVGLRMDRMGTKSLTFAFRIEAMPGARPLAKGKSVMVVYDNKMEKSIPVPPAWREKINQFETVEVEDETP